ncbi:hypothetical protein ACFLZR_01160 [Candidatus Neomarinimicrobiota bacterium]
MMNAISDIILALDFDGVICDSLEECLVSTWNAWHRLRGSDEWAETTSSIPMGIAHRFRRNRHFARNAPEFWCIIHWAITEETDIPQDQYPALVAEHAASMAAFEPVFFESRHRLSTADPEQWLALHTMYPEFLDGWDDLRSVYPVYIVTTKDLKSVRMFNRHWSLGIPDDHLWTKERALPKADMIRHIAFRHHLPMHRIFFVDDHPDIGRSVSATEANCFWASWGFLGAVSTGIITGGSTALQRIDRLADLRPFLLESS